LEVKICTLSGLNFEHSFIYLTISILNTLILLDLDHTLIYGSYATSESAPLLFSYSQYLNVYERPYARQFISHLQDLGDIIVFTTAKEDYAMKICELLDIWIIRFDLCHLFRSNWATCFGSNCATF